MPPVAHFIAPETFGSGTLLGLISVFVLTPLCILGYRRLGNAPWASHARLTIGFLLICAGMLLVGAPAQAFTFMLLATCMPPAVYFGMRLSIPYAAIGTLAIGGMMLLADDPWDVAMAICSGLAALMLTGSAIVAQHRTSGFARLHRELAHSDPLTGLANVRALNDALDAALAGSAPIALYAIDLDNFKQVNDDFDHARGDAVLKAVAKELSWVAEGDLVARRGGDEFSVLVRDTRGRELDRFARELADAIARARMQTCPQVTPSGSAAYVCGQSGDDAETITMRADDALHRVKEEFHRDDAGRERPRLAVLDNRPETARATQESIADTLIERRAEEPADAERPHWRGSTTVDRPLWSYSAVMSALTGLALILVSAAGWTGSFTPLAGALLGGGLVIVAAGCQFAARAPLHSRYMHIAFVADLVLLSGAVYLAGASGAALIDLYAIFAIFAFHFFSARVAARYLVVALGAYAAFALSGHYPYAAARVTVFAVMMLFCAGLIGKVRAVSRDFILMNLELSQRDVLTGVANVRAMRVRIGEALRATAVVGTRAPAVIAIDLDDFKSVNDNFSHSVGDKVLMAVAHAITDNVRDEDMVARRGGDEFVVVTDASGDNPAALAARIASAIAEARERICPGMVASASVAVAAWEPGDDVDSLMLRADRNLHASKTASRGHVRLAG